ncbi:hypothetical protein [Methanospirillum hungatei]|uniref:hypothetical protein n=1 Tax=Methanospirillum hungatei TaxID=2203 RepID=UPI001B6E34AD|nr:hypothetical protein [Methanospirillum hungatei]MBP9009164.1 hypothetical protein [Methanospirillum sp.]HOW05929.1 hypothetical protein [Methanospirillum hungatei]
MSSPGVTSATVGSAPMRASEETADTTGTMKEKRSKSVRIAFLLIMPSIPRGNKPFIMISLPDARQEKQP